MVRYFTKFLFLLCPFVAAAQLSAPVIVAESGGYASNSNKAPFWFYTNKYGAFSTSGHFAYMRALAHSKTDSAKNLELNYGIDIYGTYDSAASLQFNQAYLKLRWFFLVAKAGMYRQNFGNIRHEVSAGSLLYSANARPYPKISIGIEDYLKVPFTKGYLEVKGEITHGWAENKNRWVKNSYIHYKYIAVRAGGSFPLNVNYGFHHALQWGGTSINPKYGRQPESFSDFMYMFFAKNPPNVNAPLGERINQVGNHLGSNQYGIDYNLQNVTFGAYYQNIFEDKSGKLMFSKQGDGLYGIYFKNKNESRFIQQLTFEVIKTTYQSGPISLGWVVHGPDTIWDTTTGGNDNYFNNYVYQNWSYYGYTIGTPFITSPVIQNSTTKYISNNRVLACHFGGVFQFNNYRITTLYSYSLNKGTYKYPLNPMVQHTLYINIAKPVPQFYNMLFSVTLGADYGKFLGNNWGLGLSAQKTF